LKRVSIESAMGLSSLGLSSLGLSSLGLSSLFIFCSVSLARNSRCFSCTRTKSSNSISISGSPCSSHCPCLK
ncbi:MAG: hypothetical protein DRQ44_09530, partial [Gammaproteobacteria bacterium]